MRRVILAAAALALAGCAAPPAPAPTQAPVIVRTTPPATSAAPSPTATPTVTTSPLRSVHTPGTLALDEPLLPGSCHARIIDAAAGYVLPDSNCTPGAVDPAVTDATAAATICVSGYTATVRPPATETGRFKMVALAAYGMKADPSIELDHLIPLELGGASSGSNLWPEPNHAGATSPTNPKDALENRLHKAVCSGAMTLETAQAIMLDWPHNL